MLIDRIYQKVKAFLNTDVRGNVRPEKFNLFLHDAIQSRNEEYFYEINLLINKQNRGMINNYLENIPDRFREKALHYLKTTTLALDGLSTTTRLLPSDYRYIDTPHLMNGDELEFCHNMKDFNIKKFAATSQYPIYTIVSNKIRIHPESTDLMNISYLRTIKYPKWTYSLVSGAELFNPSASDFQDADIHSSEENEMVRRVLLAFGVNVKELDIQQFAVNQENQDFNQNNAV